VDKYSTLRSEGLGESWVPLNQETLASQTPTRPTWPPGGEIYPLSLTIRLIEQPLIKQASSSTRTYLISTLLEY
jgi:hypothetical protein